jgi:hypothetical protein
MGISFRSERAVFDDERAKMGYFTQKSNDRGYGFFPRDGILFQGMPSGSMG